MEVVILIGLQASGKSTCCKERLFDTHLRINLDMLRTRNRERKLLQVCLAIQQSVVVDNTNPTRQDRQRYLPAAKEAGFKVVGYYFQSRVERCVQRNKERPERKRIPVPRIEGTSRKLEPPHYDEGFDELYYVRIAETDEFIVEQWADQG